MGLKLIGEVSLDGSGFDRGIKRLGATLKSTLAGAFGFVAIEAAFRKTIDTADELVTASKRLDTTVEQLQVLREAAKENKVEIDKLSTSFERLNVSREKALA